MDDSILCSSITCCVTDEVTTVPPPTLHELTNIFHNTVSAGIAVLFLSARPVSASSSGDGTVFFVALGLPRCVLSLDVFTLFLDYARFSLKNTVFNAQLGEGLDLTVH